MLILYVRTGCPFCGRVLKTGESLGIEFQKRNIADPGIEDELVARGGRCRVPYLIDEEESVEMYESQRIIDHLHRRFKEPSLG
ncbi:MAG TPA: glutathione S-transferase N-terminal domain-containing protein [Candidatus Paceibacterota bacterium]|jgi:glutaredoxin